MKAKQSTKEKLIHGGYIVLYAIFYSIAEIVLSAIVIFQFIHNMLKDDVNLRLKTLSKQINTYVYDVLQFVTFNSDSKPYPFSAWKK